MKTKQFVYLLSTLVLAGTLMLGGCRKKTKETEDPDDDQTTAQENQLAENMMSDVSGIGSQGSENGTLSTYKMDGSADVFGVSSASLSFDIPNKTFTVDFGAYPGQTGNDGRKRSGKLIFNYSASTNSATVYRQPGFHLSITSSNYTVDDYTVNIVNKTIKNTTPISIPTGTNPGTNLTWSISASVNILKPASAGGGTITWNCNRTKTLMNTNDPMCYGGQGVPINWSKAKISISGSASGTTSQGESYTANLSGLTRDFANCGAALKYPFISGTLEFTPGSKATRYIDFGSGTCDRSATVTIKGITYSFNF